MVDLSDLTPETQDALRRMQAALGARGFTLGDPISAFRTYNDQQQLYANMLAGRAGRPLPYPSRGAVRTAARPGYSAHEFGTAFDTGLHGPALDYANSIAPGLGLTSMPGDPGHFQQANWRFPGPLGPDQAPPAQVAPAPQAPAPTVANAYANPPLPPVQPQGLAPVNTQGANLNAPMPPQRPDMQPPAPAPAPAAPAAPAPAPQQAALPTTPSPSTPGVTLSSTPSDLTTLMNNIAGIESGGRYSAMGPMTKGDRPYGKYQVMGANIPGWTQDVLGQSMTPQQFLNNPQAQEAVANSKLGGWMNQYGPSGAARMWFTGSPTGRGSDITGTTSNDYVNRATKGIDTPGGPGPMDPMIMAGGPGAGAAGTAPASPMAGLGGGLGKLGKTLSDAGQGDQGKQQGPEAPEFKLNPALPRNVTPLAGMAPQLMQAALAPRTLNVPPGPPGQMMGAGMGVQGPNGVTLNALNQLQMLLAGYDPGAGAYTGGQYG